MKINNVGFMGNPLRVMSGLDSIYGYDIAVNDILKALIRYGSFESLTCFYEPGQYQEQALKRKYRSVKKKYNTNLKLQYESEYDVMYGRSDAEIDVMYNPGMEFMPQIFYRETCSAKPFPFTYTIHGASYPYYLNEYYLLKLFMPFHSYDSLICTSKAVRDAVKNILDRMEHSLEKNYGTKLHYEGRMDVIPLGVDTEQFSPGNRAENRAEMNLPQDAFILLWIGRFSAYDKADLLPLITMFKRLTEANKDKKIILILAGHDRKTIPFVPQMKQYISELGLDGQVIVDEHNDVGKRQKLFSSADVFVSPADNIQETFGITPIEAMACGIPQIVSDWDGYKDTVEDGETGFRIPVYWNKGCDTDICHSALLPSEPMHRSGLHHLLLSQSVAVDMDAYQKAVQNLIDHPELKEEMSKRSIQRAREKFSWKTVIAQYEQLWAELKEIQLKSDDIRCPEKMDFLVPYYCRNFSSYPTKYLSAQEKVYLTKEGEQLLNGEWTRPIHYEAEWNLEELKVSMDILQEAAKAGKNGLSLSEAVDKFSKVYSESMAARAFMYLIKQCFVSFLCKE